MKILSNKAYSELIAEIKSLREKAEKYDIYLQKSRARKAKARAKEKGLQKKEVVDHLAVSDPVEQVTGISEVEKFARENLGRKVILKPETGRGGAIGFVAGYSNGAIGYILIGFAGFSGWLSDKLSSGVTLAEHRSYWWVKIDEIVFN